MIGMRRKQGDGQYEWTGASILPAARAVAGFKLQMAHLARQVDN